MAGVKTIYSLLHMTASPATWSTWPAIAIRSSSGAPEDQSVGLCIARLGLLDEAGRFFTPEAELSPLGGYHGWWRQRNKEQNKDTIKEQNKAKMERPSPISTAVWFLWAAKIPSSRGASRRLPRTGQTSPTSTQTARQRSPAAFERWRRRSWCWRILIWKWRWHISEIPPGIQKKVYFV